MKKVSEIKQPLVTHGRVTYLIHYARMRYSYVPIIRTGPIKRRYCLIFFLIESIISTGGSR